MKLIVSSSNLLKHLNYVSGVISTNPALPILENFLFDLNKNKLTITGTDIETTIITTLEVESNDDGKICIPSKIILEYLKTVTEQPVSFKIDLKTSTIISTTSSGTRKFKGEEAKHFPNNPSEEIERKITIKNYNLLDAINNTLFAIANDESRPNMNGLFFELGNNAINFVSTNGHRLVKYTVNNLNIDQTDSFIVPKKPLSILKNFIADNDQELSINFNKRHLFINTENATLICTFLDATFPDYKSVIPEHTPLSITISTQELQKAIRSVSIFGSKGNNLVKFSVKPSQLSLTAKDKDFDCNAEEKLNCQYSGESIEIGFNSKSLIEILNIIKTEEVVIKFSMPSKPAMILPFIQEENTDLSILQIPLMLMLEEDED